MYFEFIIIYKCNILTNAKLCINNKTWRACLFQNMGLPERNHVHITTVWILNGNIKISTQSVMRFANNIVIGQLERPQITFLTSFQIAKQSIKLHDPPPFFPSIRRSIFTKQDVFVDWTCRRTISINYTHVRYSISVDVFCKPASIIAAAVTWLKYCRYSVKLYLINQSIDHCGLW